MTVLERISNAAIVPVVVIDDVKDAVLTANALLRGGIDVMEITLRTNAGLDAIQAVAEGCPYTLVGAGTVTTLEQCKKAVNAGAKFIVLPGFNRSVVEWCVKNDIAVTPGCVTPTEIMEAIECGLAVLKFFPANVYGGLAAMKALSGPFTGVKFIPTGGINLLNMVEYLNAPFVHAVGGSWVCAKKDISDNNFDLIESLSREARAHALGFELIHVGINLQDADSSMAVATQFNKAFGFEVRPGGSSNFAGDGIEVMKSIYLGDNGHIAIRTNSIERAISHLESKGFEADLTTAKFRGNRVIAVYLAEHFGGFAVHLLQK